MVLRHGNEEGKAMKKVIVASVLTLLLATATSRAAEVDVVDLKLDIDNMLGQEVTVEGNVTVMGDMASISDPLVAFDMSPVMLSIEELSREDRKFLLTQCSPTCKATITGKIGMVLFQPGVIATKLEAR